MIKQLFLFVCFHFLYKEIHFVKLIIVYFISINSNILLIIKVFKKCGRSTEIYLSSGYFSWTENLLLPFNQEMSLGNFSYPGQHI